MATNKIPLIYILSNGRSGSTLLELLLGAHRNVWTTGEVEYLPWELVDNEKPCGCGVPVADCDFWRAVLAKAPIGKGNYPVEYFRTYKGRRQGKLLRWGLLPDVLRGRVSARRHTAIGEYGESNAEMFRAILGEASSERGNDIHWIVDSSKSFYRLFWLQASGFFKIKVVHILKDPRAFVYSMLRDVNTKEMAADKKRKTVRFVAKWVVENWLASRLCKKTFPASDLFELRYEDLATSPIATMNRIGDWLGITEPDKPAHSFRDSMNHGVFGNPTRWKDTPIVLDESWRRELPAAYKHAAWMATWPVRRSFGYKSFDHKAA